VAGICSKHRDYDPDCDLCEADLEDLFGRSMAAAMRAEAEEAGLYTCDCGFEYYKTVDSCPRCGALREIIIP